MLFLVTPPPVMPPILGCVGMTSHTSLPPPPPTYTLQIFVNILPWVLSIRFRSDDSAIVTPQTSYLTIFLSLYLNLNHSPVSRHLYTTSTCCPQNNQGVHTIAYIFIRFFYRPSLSSMRTSNASVFFTHMGFLPAMWPSSAS